MANNAQDGGETSVQEAMSTIAWQALRINKLENENVVLRAQVENYTKGLATARSRDNCGAETLPAAAAGLHSRESYEALAQQYNEVQTAFDRFKAHHAGCEARVRAAQDKCKEYKDYAKRWKDYLIGKGVMKPTAGQHSRSLDSNYDRSAFEPPLPPRSESTEPAPRPVNLAKRAVEPSATLGASSDFPLPSSPSALPPVKDGGRAQSRLGFSRVTSSQTTEDDTPPQSDAAAPTAQDDDSDFEPIFVSARSLKRKGKTSASSERPTQRIKQEPKSPETVIELGSSSPRRPPEVRHEISDLDAIGTRMVTPRRPRRVNDLRGRASSEEMPMHRTNLMRHASSLSEGDEHDSTANVEPSKDGINERHMKPVNPGRSDDRRNTPTNRALQALSVNVPTVPRSAARASGEKHRLKRTSARDKIRVLSEDGEEATQTVEGQAQQAGDDVLEDLLNVPPPGITPSLMRSAQEPFATSRNKRQARHFPTPESVLKRSSPERLARSPVKRISPRQAPRSPAQRSEPQRACRSPVKRSAPQQASRSPVKHADALRKSPISIRPEDEPLRNQPLANLRLEDFKVNPKYLGTTYAFADTLRGRDNRRGLHTCTREDCCGGAWHKAIAVGGTDMSGKTDDEALRAFLGQDWEDHMSGYSSEKKKEIITQAHVFALANEHGKHKSAFERRSTPPGFWDTDFPTTQQVQDNRVKAGELEKKQIEERWREAMRDGGRWLFRDE